MKFLKNTERLTIELGIKSFIVKYYTIFFIDSPILTIFFHMEIYGQ